MGARRQFIDVTYSFFVALAIALVLFMTVHAVQSRPDIAEETRERVGFLLLFPLSIAIITGDDRIRASAVELEGVAPAAAGAPGSG